jgi:hypothetical protein
VGNPDVAAIVIVGGVAIVPARQQDWAVHNGLLTAGAGEIATRPVTTAYRMFAATDPDFRSEPGRWWRKVAQPVAASLLAHRTRGALDGIGIADRARELLGCCRQRVSYQPTGSKLDGSAGS